ADKAGVSRLWVRWLERGKASIELGLAMRTLLALRLDVEVSPSPPPKDDELDINAVVERSTGMP
ncbi:MAG: hypothetical protein KC492_02225, partial [Myxococcales bacterium]|nr:hypothetical protein [Myxococcales bacterium]